MLYIPCVVHLGRSSIRHTNYGTPFIRELVKTLYKHSSHTDLATLFYLVSILYSLIFQLIITHCKSIQLIYTAVIQMIATANYKRFVSQ